MIQVPENIKKILTEVSRILLGCVFVFSGFVKAVDPLGSTYKFQDYFTAFGMNFFHPLALPASFLLSAIEFALGVFLLAAIYRRFTTILTLLFMIFMTCLTFYLAVKNPVTDCGCFGDALVITNWETFFKNVVLMVFTVILFLWYRYMTPLFSRGSSSLVAVYTYVFILGVSFYCYRNLPILDFRPYKIGTDIPEKMIIPEGAQPDEYESTFIYEKEGVRQEFTVENYPAGDSSWTFVDATSKLIKKGYQPAIHDFTITTTAGDDMTNTVLADTAYTFLLIAHKLEKANDSNVDRMNELYDFSQRFGYNYYMLTASTPDQIKEWIEDTGAEYPVCTTDDITLKTIIRSNPGMMLIKGGVVVNKWAHRNLPVGEELDKSLYETKLGKTPPNRYARKVMCCAAILIVPLVLLSVSDYTRYRKSKEKK